MKNKSPILMTPGPVPIGKEVKVQLGRDMTHHRSQEIIHALSGVKQNLQHIFQTQEPAYILNATGTGAMEAALTNTLSSGDEVIVVRAGKFGDRWKELSLTYQLIPHDIQVPWGSAVTVSIIQEKLKQNPKTKAVLVQACETSTAVLHPIQEIAQLTKNNPNTLLIVDAISALLAVDLPMDAWGLDVLIGGSQKSFALPAGMSFIALSKKAQAFQKNSKLPVYYFDLKKEKKANAQGQTAFSGNASFIRALKAELEEFQKIGIPNVQKKIQLFSQATHQFCKDLNLSLFSSAPCPSVTGICIPEGVDGVLVKKKMEEQNVIVGGGQNQLKGKIIRLGHLGALNAEDYIQGLKVFGETLREQKRQLFSKEQIQTALLKAQQTLKKY